MNLGSRPDLQHASVPVRERVAGHHLDQFAEHGSGWVLPEAGFQQPATQSATTSTEAFVQDGGEANVAQSMRIAELQIPLPDKGQEGVDANVQPAAHLPDKAPAPEDPTMDPAVDSAASNFHPSHYMPDEAVKMGLGSSHTERAYHRTASRIRESDLRLALSQFGSDHSASWFDGSSAPPEQAYIPLSDQLPGSVAATFVTRRENPVTNDIEQILVTNPEARRLLLDKGTFCTHYRNLPEYPAIMRQFLEPKTGHY